jgi:hypothetical protein
MVRCTVLIHMYLTLIRHGTSAPGPGTLDGPPFYWYWAGLGYIYTYVMLCDLNLSAVNCMLLICNLKSEFILENKINRMVLESIWCMICMQLNYEYNYVIPKQSCTAAVLLFVWEYPLLPNFRNDMIIILLTIKKFFIRKWVLLQLICIHECTCTWKGKQRMGYILWLLICLYHP